MTTHATPYLDIKSPAFKMASDDVEAARSANWYAKTNYGIAVLSYEDTAALMKHPSLTQGSADWPDTHDVHEGPFYDWWQENLLVLEGDRHDRLRRLVNPAFSRRKIQPFKGYFEDLANELLDSFESSGQVDFATEFAGPYATRILCKLLGIPESDWPTLYRLASQIGLGLSVHIGERKDEIDAAIEEMDDYARTLVAARRVSPGPDVVTSLVEARDENDGRLSDAELHSLVILLIFAGIDTTRNQLAMAIDLFSRQPDAWEKLSSDPEHYMDRATEECMRINPIARWVTRQVSEPFEHKGLKLNQGTIVHLFTLSSGTDPDVFSSPKKIDLDGAPEPHFAFGGGIHHCLGHFVARADIAVALKVLSTRIKDIKVCEGAEWLHDSGNTGPVKLPIAFVSRSRSVS